MAVSFTTGSRSEPIEATVAIGSRSHKNSRQREGDPEPRLRIPFDPVPLSAGAEEKRLPRHQRREYSPSAIADRKVRYEDVSLLRPVLVERQNYVLVAEDPGEETPDGHLTGAARWKHIRRRRSSWFPSQTAKRRPLPQWRVGE